ncbi:hypothetical protein [Tissierella praeacuta]
MEKYEQAKDGAYFHTSIKEFCTMPVSGRKIKGLAYRILLIMEIIKILKK